MTQRTWAIRSWLIVVLCLAMDAPLSADTFIVNSTRDAAGMSPGGGVAAEGYFTTTLRSAIRRANAHPGPHTIILRTHTYRLDLIGPGEDEAATGDLDLRTEIAIIGDGSGKTIIDGCGLDRVFHTGFAPDTPITIRGVTIRNGDAGGEPGGGIWCMGDSSLFLEDVRIENTRATEGGAVYKDAGDLTMIDCNTHHSISINDGGAIMKVGLGVVSMTGCFFESDIAGGSGGAAHIADAGAVAIESCAFEGAIAGIQGGGVFLGNVSSLVMRHTDVVDNVSCAEGGGVCIAGGGASLVLEDVTFSGNISTAASGGGLFAATVGPATLTNVHVADNTAGADGGGAFFTGQSAVIVEGGSFVDNVAQDGPGGGLHVAIGGEVGVRTCDISGNVAMSGHVGGGLMIDSLGATVEGCFLSYNQSIGLGANGGGIYMNPGLPGGFITNSTFAYNSTAFQGWSAQKKTVQLRESRKSPNSLE